jgi:hypothetical protein
MKILLFRAHKGDPISKIIKAITRSVYSHAAILVDTIKWRDAVACRFDLLPVKGHLIIEAVWPKVHARYLDDEELGNIDVYDVPAHTPDREDHSMNWLVDQLAEGIRYDVWDLFRFLAIARKFLGDGDSKSYKRFTFCSMLDYNAFRVGGTRLFSPLVHDRDVSPDKLSWSPLAIPVPQLTCI